MSTNPSYSTPNRSSPAKAPPVPAAAPPSGSIMSKLQQNRQQQILTSNNNINASLSASTVAANQQKLKVHIRSPSSQHVMDPSNTSSGTPVILSSATLLPPPLSPSQLAAVNTSNGSINNNNNNNNNSTSATLLGGQKVVIHRSARRNSALQFAVPIENNNSSSAAATQNNAINNNINVVQNFDEMKKKDDDKRQQHQQERQKQSHPSVKRRKVASPNATLFDGSGPLPIHQKEQQLFNSTTTEQNKTKVEIDEPSVFVDPKNPIFFFLRPFSHLVSQSTEAVQKFIPKALTHPVVQLRSLLTLACSISDGSTLLVTDELINLKDIDNSSNSDDDHDNDSHANNHSPDNNWQHSSSSSSSKEEIEDINAFEKDDAQVNRRKNSNNNDNDDDGADFNESTFYGNNNRNAWNSNLISNHQDGINVHNRHDEQEDDFFGTATSNFIRQQNNNNNNNNDNINGKVSSSASPNGKKNNRIDLENERSASKTKYTSKNKARAFVSPFDNEHIVDSISSAIPKGVCPFICALDEHSTPETVFEFMDKVYRSRRYEINVFEEEILDAEKLRNHQLAQQKQQQAEEEERRRKQEEELEQQEQEQHQKRRRHHHHHRLNKNFIGNNNQFEGSDEILPTNNNQSKSEHQDLIAAAQNLLIGRSTGNDKNITENEELDRNQSAGPQLPQIDYKKDFPSAISPPKKKTPILVLFTFGHNLSAKWWSTPQISLPPSLLAVLELISHRTNSKNEIVDEEDEAADELEHEHSVKMQVLLQDTDGSSVPSSFATSPVNNSKEHFRFSSNSNKDNFKNSLQHHHHNNNQQQQQIVEDFMEQIRKSTASSTMNQTQNNKNVNADNGNQRHDRKNKGRASSSRGSITISLLVSSQLYMHLSLEQRSNFSFSFPLPRDAFFEAMTKVRHEKKGRDMNDSSSASCLFPKFPVAKSNFTVLSSTAFPSTNKQQTNLSQLILEKIAKMLGNPHQSTTSVQEREQLLALLQNLIYRQTNTNNINDEPKQIDSFDSACLDGIFSKFSDVCNSAGSDQFFFGESLLSDINQNLFDLRTVIARNLSFNATDDVWNGSIENPGSTVPDRNVLAAINQGKVWMSAELQRYTAEAIAWFGVFGSYGRMMTTQRQQTSGLDDDDDEEERESEKFLANANNRLFEDEQQEEENDNNNFENPVMMDRNLSSSCNNFSVSNFTTALTWPKIKIVLAAYALLFDAPIQHMFVTNDVLSQEVETEKAEKRKVIQQRKATQKRQAQNEKRFRDALEASGAAFSPRGFEENTKNNNNNDEEFSYSPSFGAAAGGGGLSFSSDNDDDEGENVSDPQSRRRHQQQKRKKFASSTTKKNRAAVLPVVATNTFGRVSTFDPSGFVAASSSSSDPISSKIRNEFDFCDQPPVQPKKKNRKFSPSEDDLFDNSSSSSTDFSKNSSSDDAPDDDDDGGYDVCTFSDKKSCNDSVLFDPLPITVDTLFSVLPFMMAHVLEPEYVPLFSSELLSQKDQEGQELDLYFAEEDYLTSTHFRNHNVFSNHQLTNNGNLPLPTMLCRENLLSSRLRRQFSHHVHFLMSLKQEDEFVENLRSTDSRQGENEKEQFFPFATSYVLTSRLATKPVFALMKMMKTMREKLPSHSILLKEESDLSNNNNENEQLNGTNNNSLGQNQNLQHFSPSVVFQSHQDFSSGGRYDPANNNNNNYVNDEAEDDSQNQHQKYSNNNYNINDTARIAQQLRQFQHSNPMNNSNNMAPLIQDFNSTYASQNFSSNNNKNNRNARNYSSSHDDTPSLNRTNNNGFSSMAASADYNSKQPGKEKSSSDNKMMEQEIWLRENNNENNVGLEDALLGIDSSELICYSKKNSDDDESNNKKHDKTGRRGDIKENIIYHVAFDNVVSSLRQFLHMNPPTI